MKSKRGSNGDELKTLILSGADSGGTNSESCLGVWQLSSTFCNRLRFRAINQISVLRITPSHPLSGLKNNCEHYATRSNVQCSKTGVNINEAHFSPAEHTLDFPCRWSRSSQGGEKFLTQLVMNGRVCFPNICGQALHSKLKWLYLENDQNVCKHARMAARFRLAQIISVYWKAPTCRVEQID